MKTTQTIIWALLFLMGNIALPQEGPSSNYVAQEEVSNSKSILTQELKELYAQSKLFENSTPEEIEKNRLAIKNAWMAVDPEKAALYKPVNKKGLNESFIEPVVTLNNTESMNTKNQSLWGVNNMIHDNLIDGGVDIVGFDDSSQLYASSYQNNPNGLLHMYLSTDRGDSWEFLWNISIGGPFKKLELLALDGSFGDRYLLIFYIDHTDTFRIIRHNLSLEPPLTEFETIAGDVKDFTIDRNYTDNTVLQRVFTMFERTNGDIFSARSTAGSHGFDWVDETLVNFQRSMPSLAYGRNGTLYYTNVRMSDGDLLVRVNTDYNDPNAWEPSELIEDGSVRESLNPTIRAEREVLAADNVLVVTSSRGAGQTGKYNVRRYRRTNGGAFSNGITNASPDGVSYLYFDSFIDYEVDAQIHVGYLRFSIDGSENNRAAHRPYDGSILNTTTLVSFEELNVFRQVKPIAIYASTEGSDEEPMMVFAGTSDNGLFGEGLYFDKESSILSTESFTENNVTTYPNPVTDKVTIKLPQEVLLQNIEISDVSGRAVDNIDFQNHNSNSQLINLSSYANGVYFFTIHTSRGKITKKIIKR